MKAQLIQLHILTRLPPFIPVPFHQPTFSAQYIQPSQLTNNLTLSPQLKKRINDPKISFRYYNTLEYKLVHPQYLNSKPDPKGPHAEPPGSYANPTKQWEKAAPLTRTVVTSKLFLQSTILNPVLKLPPIPIYALRLVTSFRCKSSDSDSWALDFIDKITCHCTWNKIT